MRLPLISICLTVLVLWTASQADDSLPRSATVTSQSVQVRSGPGESFYVTGRLESGQQVQVYRRDPGGWLAIRPPQDSFSWVRKEDVEESDQIGVLRVTRGGAVCRTGSAVASVKDFVSQVRLSENELLETLAVEALTHPWNRLMQKREWLAVAPPAGEFRWVKSQDLETQSREAGGDAPVQSLLGWQTEAAAALEASALEASEVEEAAFEEEADRPENRKAADRQTQEPSPAGDATGDGIQDDHDASQESPPASSDGWVQRGSGQKARNVPNVRPLLESSEPPPKTTYWSSRRPPTAADMERAEIELAALVAEPPDQWQLEPLRQRVTEMARSLSDIEQRLRARKLLERIDEFQALRQRMAAHPEGLAGISVPANSASAKPPTPSVAIRRPEEMNFLSTPPAGDGPAETDPGTKYDGRGWLVPVHSSKRTVPPYALLDEQGDVLQYVSPAPGLNLHRYLRKRVGLYGQRGFAPALSKPHLTAERVVDINRHLR